MLFRSCVRCRYVTIPISVFGDAAVYLTVGIDMFWLIHQEIVSFSMQSDEPNGKAMATIFVLLSLQAEVRCTEYSLFIILNQKLDTLGHRSRNSILCHVKFRTGQVCDFFFISARQDIIGHFCHSGIFGLE